MDQKKPVVQNRLLSIKQRGCKETVILSEAWGSSKRSKLIVPPYRKKKCQPISWTAHENDFKVIFKIKVNFANVAKNCFLGKKMPVR